MVAFTEAKNPEQSQKTNHQKQANSLAPRVLSEDQQRFRVDHGVISAKVRPLYVESC